MVSHGDNITNQIDAGVNVPVRNRNYSKALTGAVYHDGNSLDDISKMVKKIIKEDMWKIQSKGEGIIEFETFEKFVTTDMPEGMGTTIQRLRDLCRNDIETLALIDEMVQKPRGGPNNPKGLGGKSHKKPIDNNVIQSIDNSDRSNRKILGRRRKSSVVYVDKEVNQSLDNKKDRSAQILRRLRKDFPEQYQEVISGKKKIFSTGVETGIYPKRVSINLKDPVRAANTLIGVLEKDQISREFLSEFIDALVIRLKEL